MLDSSRAHDFPSHSSLLGALTRLVLVCMWLLICSTVSPPEDFKVSQYGTAPILPPAVLSLIKLATRLAAIVILGWAAVSTWRHPDRDRVVARLLPLAGFAMFGLVSVLWSPDKGISLKQVFSFGVLVMLSYNIAILWRGDQDSRRWFSHLAIGLWLIGLTLLIIHFAMPRVGALTKDSSGIFHSTGAGAASGLGILAVLGLRLFWNTPLSKLWPVIVLTHLTVMLVAGNRLSVIITTLTVLGVLIVYAHRGALAAAALGLSVLGTSYLFVDPKLDAVYWSIDVASDFAKQGQSRKELSSFSGREEMWTKIWDSYLQSPWIGHGYFVTSSTGRIYVWNTWGNWTAHNFWLQALATTGLVGLGLLTAALLWIARGAWQGCKAMPHLRGSIVMPAVMAVWFLGWGLLNESFIGPLSAESVVFAVVAGIASAVGAKSATPRHPSTPAPHPVYGTEPA